jgi:hypothetical protein
MKELYKLDFKNVVTFLILLLVLTVNVQAQTPQYYNANSGGIGNTIPFNQATGYKSQWLIGPGEYSQPSPAPAGNITKLYIFMSTTGGPATYTQLTIKMGLTSLTSFPSGIYAGPLDTVYYRLSATLSSTINTWMMITLDRPFYYNPAQSLVIEISHCGFSGTGMNIWQTAGTTGIFRRNNIPGTTSCVFTYSSQDTRILQNGIDIAPAAPKNFALRLPTPGVNTNYVMIPYQSSMAGITNVTIEAWVKIGGTTTANTVLNKGAASFDYQLGINASTANPFFRAQGVIISSTIVMTPVWTHLAVTYDGTNTRFYKDGVLSSSSTTPAPLGTSTNEMRLGRGNADAGSGNLEEVRVWSVARTQGQIDSNKCIKYPSGFFGGTTGLKALWHLDSTYVDSINGWNGTPMGSVGFDTLTFPHPTMSCIIVGIGNKTSELPKEFNLEQNYPNPFNPTTTIHFSIPKGTFVEITLYDVLGKKVATLLREPKQAGRYELTIDGTKLASGVYFYKMEAGNYSDIKKMVLIK